MTVVYKEGTPDQVVALRGISLRVAKGETFVVTGGNGCGKSTLLKAIAGTVPIKSGTVRINGTNVTHWPAHRRAKFLGFVHQDPMLGTCPSLTIHENCRLVSRQSWWWPFPEQLSLEEQQSRLIEAGGLPLQTKAATALNSLSGGQRQALALVMALSSGCSILLMDEFTSSLDDSVRTVYLELIKNESARRRITIIAVLHDSNGIGVLNGRTARLVTGSLECTGSERVP
jgi:putative ABC transport system ATP-binding protein